MKKNEKCYMCEAPAVSMEHVPPKCLFPEKKDTEGIDFRKNLIKVPSCHVHNSQKDTDDEFLMFSLAGLIDNNLTGQLHQMKKVDRALRKKNHDFINSQVLKNYKLIKVKTQDDTVKEANIGTPNFDRLTDCFEHIAYGLYYHEFNKVFTGEISCIINFLEYTDKKFTQIKKLIKKRFSEEEELKLSIKGENKEVFTYQFLKPDKDGLIALKTVFYGSAEVYFSFKDNNIEPEFNFVNELLKAGHKTTFMFDDDSITIN